MPSRLRRYDEPGHTHFWTASCYQQLDFFEHDAMKNVVVEGIRMLQERFGVCLIAYVVMPNHVHLIVYPHARGEDRPVPASKLWYAFKKHIGFHGKQRLRSLWRESGGLWSDSLNTWARGRYGKQSVMHARGYDFNIDRQHALLEKVEYCHKNPITRGLVDRPEDWRWSSYRYYELADASVLKMDWDGGWPIAW